MACSGTSQQNTTVLTGITADSGDQLHLNSNGNLSSAAALIGTAIKARLGW